MEKRIVDICEKVCNETLAWDEPLISSGLLTSYLIMELICSLEEEFQIRFEPEEIMLLENFSCINNIIDIIKKKY